MDRPIDQPVVTIPREQLLQLERSMTREWLETDGRGGYASSTVLMCATRRYHGLLVASREGSAKRHVYLSRFDEAVHGAGRSLPLSMARYKGLFAPLGHQSIDSFELVPWPRSVWLFGQLRIERELLMARSRRAVVVRWRATGIGNDGPLTLRIKPLLPFREADATTVENIDLNPRVERMEHGVTCQPYAGLPTLALTTSGTAAFEADPVWYRGIEFSTDAARGYEAREDQFSPGWFEYALHDGQWVYAAASIDGPVEHAEELFALEADRRRAKLAASTPSVRDTLALTADDFLYRDGNGRLGVMAGWPWFGEWGRDTYLSLPGLTLARGKIEACGEVLEGSLRYLRRGLLPNIFGLSQQDSAYNSVDASLWFVRAVRQYELAGVHVREIAARFLPALEEIATCYRGGTDLGIRADASGLLVAGNGDLNATWMDAETADGPVTPRDGCAVEIEGLWYFLLAYLEYLCRASGAENAARSWGSLRREAGHAFLERFVLAEPPYLADRWKDGQADRAMRPNMVLAAALEWSPLSREQRADVVACARASLLVPCGLRTLAPHENGYQGVYAGGPKQRDEAYHQGTAWPWLLGFYVEAALRANGHDARSKSELRALLDGFAEHLDKAGLGHISEVYDGDPPHRPGGSIAQAWSTAEILRAYKLLESYRT